MAKEYGRDARLRAFVVKHVLAPAGVTFPSRQFKGQARAILSWVQRNIAYLNEPGELIQGPWQTLKVAHGDCDDMSLLVAAMAESLGLGNRFVLGGKTSSGRSVRWAEGTKGPPMGAKFFHIFADLGWPALKPTTWMSAEPTMNVPLGHDVTKHGVPAGVARGVDVSGWGSTRGLGAPGIMMPGAPGTMGAFDAPTLRKYGGDIVKLAIVGALAQLILLLFLRSKLGRKVKTLGRSTRR
jgi:transglutaminase-like putative cysteine protease